MGGGGDEVAAQTSHRPRRAGICTRLAGVERARSPRSTHTAVLFALVCATAVAHLTRSCTRSSLASSSARSSSSNLSRLRRLHLESAYSSRETTDKILRLNALVLSVQRDRALLRFSRMLGGDVVLLEEHPACECERHDEDHCCAKDLPRAHHTQRRHRAVAVCERCAPVNFPCTPIKARCGQSRRAHGASQEQLARLLDQSSQPARSPARPRRRLRLHLLLPPARAGPKVSSDFVTEGQLAQLTGTRR